jgi:hypothetical protein
MYNRATQFIQNNAITYGALLVLLPFLIYFPAINGGFIWDDDAYVTENATLRSAEGLKQIWFSPNATPQYYPLVFTTFWLEHKLWDLNPSGYHVTNIFLHGLNALLLWRLLRYLKVSWALLAAAGFALHPVHVESVAWITERKNVLSGVFYFSAAILMVKYLRLGESPISKPGDQWKNFLLALWFFICALMSKTVTCSLPAAILLMIWWKRGRIQKRDVSILLPFFILGLSAGLFTVWLERHHVGALGGEWNFSVMERILIAGRALWFYAGKLLWPADLSFSYPRWKIDAGLWRQYLWPA